jgi:hypothetical protein
MTGQPGDRDVVVHTALGDLIFDLVDRRRRTPSIDYTIETFPVVPRLAPGMSVRSATAVLLSARATTTERGLRYRCRWATPPAAEWDSGGGQDLESSSWEGRSDLVTVGTEDDEVLTARRPDCGFSPLITGPGLFMYRTLQGAREDFGSTTDGLVVVVPILKAGNTISLHFIVAENPSPEAEPESTWYAVDLPHADVLAQRP